MRSLASLAVVIACLGLALQRQRLQQLKLQEEHAALTVATRGLSQVRVEHARLKAQVSTADLEHLRSVRDTVIRLQAEVTRLSAEVPPQTGAADPEELLQKFRPEQWEYSSNPIVPARATDAGRTTIGGTMETLMWSIASPDLTALRGLITLPQQGERPPAEMESLANLIATDAARYTALQIASVTPPNHINTAILVAHLQTAEELGLDPENWKTQVRFTLTRGAEGWSLSIPSGFLSAYYARLLAAKGGAAPETSN